MFVRTAPKTPDSRICLYSVEGFRENGKDGQRNTERIGFIDQFTPYCDDVLKAL